MAYDLDLPWNHFRAYKNGDEASPAADSASFSSCATGGSCRPRETQRKIVEITMAEFAENQLFDSFGLSLNSRESKSSSSKDEIIPDLDSPPLSGESVADLTSDEHRPNYVYRLASSMSLLDWKSIRQMNAVSWTVAGVSNIDGFPLELEQAREPLISSQVVGEPDFSEARIWPYVESFKNSILSMYPVIHPSLLDQWVLVFLRTLRETRANRSCHAFNKTTDSKQKHRPSHDGGELYKTSKMTADQLGRTAHNALILMVFALGQLCLQRHNVPRLSQRHHQRMPGLAYLSLAMDILGNCVGDYRNLKTVYANIFAGIYHGQLSRPLDSFGFFHQASYKLQVIMRPVLDQLRYLKRFDLPIEDPEHNQLLIAFWTCLQLESELLEELQLPPTGLHQYEDEMPSPNMTLIEDIDQRILQSYASQVYWVSYRKKIHQMFRLSNYSLHSYGPSRQADFEDVELVVDAVSDKHWFTGNPDLQIRSSSRDDVLTARVRERYWRALVILCRPFILMILEFNHHKKYPGMATIPTQSPFRDGIDHPIITSSTQTFMDLDPRLVDLARKGLTALIESTRVFHCLNEQRPILTSVFCTAHTQWGNLLVLIAAFKDPVLSQYVDRNLLVELIDRTIKFLEDYIIGTSSLSCILDVLEDLQIRNSLE